ncbi:methyltransferase domain-containing protein [Roseovarius sp. E0-M6]|uniref:methyltransferase domain-containing protein n=1 Tax=Roseovarius sp. E0-M6 TaxID=3127118 RepID=UPI003010096B
MSDHYDPNQTGLLQALWGEGFLSPGGPDEVARVIDGLDLRGRRVLDIGCGTGAIPLLLVREHDAGHVTGIDVEDGVCAIARQRVADAGAEDRVDIIKVTPGPLPFEAAEFDVVFSKDSIIHIPDKEALAQEVFRVLRLGGVFAASDWLISHDDTPSPEMQHYLALEDLGMEMASPDRYAQALRGAGFEDVVTRNRNPWYRDVARQELETIMGPRRSEFEASSGADFVERSIETWRAMIRVLETGEHCPHHLRGRKPA